MFWGVTPMLPESKHTSLGAVTFIADQPSHGTQRLVLMVVVVVVAGAVGVTKKTCESDFIFLSDSCSSFQAAGVISRLISHTFLISHPSFPLSFIAFSASLFLYLQLLSQPLSLLLHEYSYLPSFLRLHAFVRNSLPSFPHGLTLFPPH